MTAPIKQPSFAGGEISPTLYARADNDIYGKSLRTLRNMIPMRQGGVTGRPGTMYVGHTFNSIFHDGDPVRLIPFIFNETGLGQSYMLEFGHQYIAFYQDGANVISGTKTITAITQANPGIVTSAAHGFLAGTILLITGATGMTELNNNYYLVDPIDADHFSLRETTDALQTAVDTSAFSAYSGLAAANHVYIVSSPYVQADLADLNFAQSADIVTIVNQNYPPAELARVAATNWVLTQGIQNNFGAPLGGPSGIALAGTAGPAAVFYYLTSVNENGEESDQTNWVNSPVVALTPAAPATPVTITWNLLAGAVSYRIYGYAYTPALDYIGPGFIGETGGNQFIDTGLEPDFSRQGPRNPLLFQGGPYPAVVGFIQQRRVFANTTANPIGFWMSQTGDFNNFDISTPPLDSDSVFGSLAGNEVNAITNVTELKFALMLTSGAEIYIQGDGNGVITPSSVNASVQSQYGCSVLRVLKVSDIMLFNQSLGSAIRDLAFDFAIDGYRGNDITVFASHLFEGYQITDWAYQKVPDSIIWAVRSDGVLLSCTYVREQQVLAWAHHDYINGTVENVCAIPENGEYAVYITVRRVINSQEIVYVERLSSRIWQGPAAAVANGTANALGDPIDATYLDCYASYDGRNTGADFIHLSVSPSFSDADTAYQQALDLTINNPFFTAAMVGDEIFLQDDEFVSSQGSSGNQLKCTIQVYVSATLVTVTPEGVVPDSFRLNPAQTIDFTNWAHAVQTVSGLTYLAGQEVSVWADRYLVGSPLNEQVETVYTVPASGILTLDKPYAVIYVGLPMVQDVQTLDIENIAGESMIASRKRSAQLDVYLYNTRTLFVGTENPDTNLQNTDGDYLFQMMELMKGTTMRSYDEPPDLFTGQDYVIPETRWNKNGRLFIRNVDPVPMTILAIGVSGENKSQNPGYTRV